MSSTPSTFLEQISKAIPAYLTPVKKEDLLSEVRAFPENTEYYLNSNQYSGEILQGDLWADLSVIHFETLDRKQVKGIVLSNSCDVSDENDRALPVNVSFVPLIKLSKLQQIFEAQTSPESAETKINAIRKQENTMFFYLPSSRCLTVDDEYVAYLMDIHQVPLSRLRCDSTKKISLSMIGFYLFLVKLSLHFCRFNEHVVR